MFDFLPKLGLISLVGLILGFVLAFLIPTTTTAGFGFIVLVVFAPAMAIEKFVAWRNGKKNAGNKAGV
jgi:hypothetical protein